MVNGISGAMQTDEERKAAALRIIRRAKRAGGLPARDRAYSTCEGGQFPPCSTKEPPSRSAKNSRKSRSGFGRGLPKKGKFLVICKKLYNFDCEFKFKVLKVREKRGKNSGKCLVYVI